MIYLNLDPNYFDHEKTLRLIARLGPGSEVLPLRLWARAFKSCPEDGEFKNIDAVEIEFLAGWNGEPGKAETELLRLGFIERSENGYKIHKWLEHEGHVKALSERGKAAASARWQKYRSDADALHKHADALHKHSLGNAPSRTYPNHTVPNHTTPSRSNVAPSPTGSEPPVLVFPTVGNGEKEWGLLDAKLKEYAESFPGVDALMECRKARQWCIDNVQKRKTPRGMPGFLSRWLSKAQDNGGSNGSGKGRAHKGNGSGVVGRVAAPQGKYDRFN